MAVPAVQAAAVSAAEVNTRQPQVAVPTVPAATASAAAATDYDSVDQAIAAAARDGGAPLGLSRLNLVGQVAIVRWLFKRCTILTRG